MDNTDSDAGFVYPSAFSKYLFSGACYVQLGELYAKVRELGGDPQTLADPELLNQFSGIWRDYVSQQPGFVFADFLETGLPQDPDRDHAFSGFQRELKQAINQAFDDFVDALSEVEDDQVDFSTFFDIWCMACDRAYAKLVRTESFSLALGYAMNFLLSYMPARPAS